MNAPLTRFAADPLAQADERRREPRYNTSYAARLIALSGEDAGALLVDVSFHGCCVRSDASWLRNGRFVSIHLDPDAPLEAVVRWIRDGSIGLEFLRPVPVSSHAWQDLMDGAFPG